MSNRGGPRGSSKFSDKKYHQQQYGRKLKYHPKKSATATEKALIEELQGKYEQIDAASIEKFNNLPLSPKTLRGLKDSGYVTPTEIQRETIALTLTGQDVLGAAETGSGKTLAFIIPIIEKLFCLQWCRLDGIGALVITPTRELAYQIFGILRNVGAHHDLSAGLVIGGKDLQHEKRRVDQCNIMICTPGRLLQHMDENPLFNCSNLQILVLDEADRCLDMGFENDMNAIIENLPAERQTLLFSATQTKSVRDLARLSLKDPMYVSVHDKSTPDTLQQSYIVCELQDKLNTLYSFIKTHLRQKILVFMASCNQVKYHNDLFCRLRLGPTILQLQGALHQTKRMAVYETFCEKSNAVLFATDIAARGLDFPAVDWVVHFDCPEDVTTYIHRSGRTARFKKGGESLLILLPSEEAGMIEELQANKVSITKIQTNPRKIHTCIRKVESLLAQNVQLKESAQRAFVTYVKSVFMMKNKNIFDVHALNTGAYSASLGLIVPPRIRFLQRVIKKETEEKERKEKKIAKREERAKLIEALRSTKKEVGAESSEDSSNDDDEDDGDRENKEEDDEEEEDDDDDEDSIEEPDMNHREKEAKQPFQFDAEDSDDSGGEIMVMKRVDHDLSKEGVSLLQRIEERKQEKKKALTKVAAAKKILKKKIVVNTKILFNDEGDVVADPKKEKISKTGIEYDADNFSGIDIEKARLAVIEEDKADKQRFRELNKAKRREEKKKEKMEKKAAAGGDEVQPIDEEVVEECEESEDDGDNGPDMSWLPDPDAIYGKKEDDSKEFYEPSEDEELEEVHRPAQLKRKSKNDGRELVRDKRSRGEGQPMDTGLSLLEDEELALQFLKGAG